MDSTASIEGTLICEPRNEAHLARLAEAIDKFVGKYPRSGGYDLAGSMAAILSGGTHDQIVAALHLLRSWEFVPKGGW
jgi:hypothetical protein